jgi:hypothetical protein
MQGYFVKISFLRLKRLILAAKSASYCHFKPHNSILRCQARVKTSSSAEDYAEGCQ